MNICYLLIVSVKNLLEYCSCSIWIVGDCSWNSSIFRFLELSATFCFLVSLLMIVCVSSSLFTLLRFESIEIKNSLSAFHYWWYFYLMIFLNVFENNCFLIHWFSFHWFFISLLHCFAYAMMKKSSSFHKVEYEAIHFIFIFHDDKLFEFFHKLAACIVLDLTFCCRLLGEKLCLYFIFLIYNC